MQSLLEHTARYIQEFDRPPRLLSFTGARTNARSSGYSLRSNTSTSTRHASSHRRIGLVIGASMLAPIMISGAWSKVCLLYYILLLLLSPTTTSNYCYHYYLEGGAFSLGTASLGVVPGCLLRCTSTISTNSWKVEVSAHSV